MIMNTAPKTAVLSGSVLFAQTFENLGSLEYKSFYGDQLEVLSNKLSIYAVDRSVRHIHTLKTTSI